MAKKKSPTLPQRTRDHIIASKGENYIERLFLVKGHTANPLRHDYGTDIFVETFDNEGHAENGFLRLQIRASRTLNYSIDGKFISCEIETKHARLWIEEDYPFFLVVYDAQMGKAYYLYIQEYFSNANVKKPRKNAATITVRFPVTNLFTEATVDYMQGRKIAIRSQIKGKIKHES